MVQITSAQAGHEEMSEMDMDGEVDLVPGAYSRLTAPGSARAMGESGQTPLASDLVRLAEAIPTDARRSNGGY